MTNTTRLDALKRKSAQAFEFMPYVQVVEWGDVEEEVLRLISALEYASRSASDVENLLWLCGHIDDLLEANDD